MLCYRGRYQALAAAAEEHEDLQTLSGLSSAIATLVGGSRCESWLT